MAFHENDVLCVFQSNRLASHNSRRRSQTPSENHNGLRIKRMPQSLNPPPDVLPIDQFFRLRPFLVFNRRSLFDEHTRLSIYWSDASITASSQLLSDKLSLKGTFHMHLIRCPFKWQSLIIMTIMCFHACLAIMIY